jgi:hypothetical protein
VAQICEATSIAEAVERLKRCYVELSPDEISSAVSDAHTRFAQSRIRDFVPLLVERRAREALSNHAALVTGSIQA